VRQLLFGRIHAAGDSRPQESLNRSLLEAAAPGDPLFSHLPRFLAARIDNYYAPEFKAAFGGIDVIRELRSSLPTRFFGWSPLNQAAYLEMTTRLSPYLLSAHGERMTMAHGVEGRYPFLDHRLFEFAAALPTGSRLRGLREKEVLRRWASRILPSQLPIGRRPRHTPPAAHGFFLPSSHDWIGNYLGAEALRRVGIFSAPAVGGLLRRFRAGHATQPEENQAFIGIMSTQIWHRQFIESTLSLTPLPISDASVLNGDSVPVSTPMTFYDPKPC